MQKKPLLELKNIGKIYVSDANVSVGIRGVNLAFERGEFVAVTGRSGSGKSTLLNVISGMDTYEEGELYIEGEPTSHYLQKDWELYRENYISFIFQDYNIIESFTVLQNVELALMNIEDTRARRARAMELIRRVGLEGHIHHKGSKLSGGQKQRTVIARALAKDSPVILADEPTGNLDSKSSSEIIELLREVSRDKLVIVVTHNFEEVEACATRHIRIFDGAVDLDHTVSPASPPPMPKEIPAAPPVPPRKKWKSNLKNGLILGRVRFGAMPKLSVFLCLLMTITALVLTAITATSDGDLSAVSDPDLFTHIDGRTVIVRRDGAPITPEELEKLASDVGARSVMHYDYLLDRTAMISLSRQSEYGYTEIMQLACRFSYDKNDITPSSGRLPAADDEVMISVPISAKAYLGGDAFVEYDLPLFNTVTYRVVGVHYFYDNTKDARMVFTEKGFEIATAAKFFSEQAGNFSYQMVIDNPEGTWVNHMYVDTHVDFAMAAGTYYINAPDFLKKYQSQTGMNVPITEIPLTTTLVGKFTDRYDHYYDDNYFYGDDIYVEEIHPGLDEEDPDAVQYPLTPYKLLADVSDEVKAHVEAIYFQPWQDGYSMAYADFVVLSPDILTSFMQEHYYQKAYTQASLFFENDREAHAKVETLRDLGYVAVPSDETVESMEVLDKLLVYVILAFSMLSWILTVVFATLFLNLCASRAMNATRGDIAIMRSMGIPTAVVRISIYVQTLIALIPAFLVTAIAAVIVYTQPATNYIFTFLHAGDYLLLAVMLVAIAANLSRKQAAKMFSGSVKKTLRERSKA